MRSMKQLTLEKIDVNNGSYKRAFMKFKESLKNAAKKTVIGACIFSSLMFGEGCYTPVKELITQEQMSIEDLKNAVKRATSKEGPNYVNITDDKGRTLLHHVAQEGYKELVEKLIEKGANINAKDNEGRTPLMVASSKGYTDIMNLLITNGAKVNDIDKKGMSALMIAASKSKLKSCEVLIKHGANVNQRDNNGTTALMYAILGLNENVVKLLLDNGASVNIIDNKNMTPLMYAVSLGGEFSSIVELLIQRKANVNMVTPTGTTALDVAFEKNNLPAVQILLKAGAIMKPQHNQNFPELIKSLEKEIHRCDKDRIKNIVASLPYVDKTNELYPIYSELLAEALLAKCTVVADLLIERGADINYNNKNETTPFLLALGEHLFDSDFINYMISKGGNPHAKGTAFFKVMFNKCKPFLSRENITVFVPSTTCYEEKTYLGGAGGYVIVIKEPKCYPQTELRTVVSEDWKAIELNRKIIERAIELYLTTQHLKNMSEEKIINDFVEYALKSDCWIDITTTLSRNNLLYESTIYKILEFRINFISELRVKLLKNVSTITSLCKETLQLHKNNDMCSNILWVNYIIKNKNKDPFYMLRKEECFKSFYYSEQKYWWISIMENKTIKVDTPPLMLKGKELKDSDVAVSSLNNLIKNAENVLELFKRKEWLDKSISSLQVDKKDHCNVIKENIDKIYEKTGCNPSTRMSLYEKDEAIKKFLEQCP